jgi:replication factor A1
MSIEEMINYICTKHPEIPREQILEKLEEKKRKTGGLIADDVLLRMIAAEFGVEVKNNEVLTPTLTIRDLVSGLNNVTLVGLVVAVFSPRTFEGKRSGKYASLLVADRSGILRIVLWNDKTELVESGKIKTGQIIRLSHGYTREDRNGKVELHVGDKSKIEVNPSDVDAKNYRKTGKFATKIREITETYRNIRVNVAGNVKELFPASTFERQDSSVGKVMRFRLADETDEISVVVWNEKADEVEKNLRKDAEMQIVNAKVKEALSGGFEIHVDNETYLDILPSAEKSLKIAELQEGLTKVNVEGEVATKPIFRNVKTSREELVELAMFELSDDTGKIWVSAWRKHAETAKKLKVGDKVSIKDAYVKKGFGDQPELATRNTTAIITSSS